MILEYYLLAAFLVGSAYSYFIYPLILILLPKKNIFEFGSQNKQEASLPFVSFIITAYNEEARIKEKLENTLMVEYPEGHIEILVASDGSTDLTNEFVKNYADKGVRLIEVEERKGKENAQLAAINEAKGEILVFSDVSTMISSDSLTLIADTFKNKKIGALSSEDRFITEDGSIAGEGAYIKYEMWLRKLEAEVHSLIGLSGSFFACRKIICSNWNINVPSDFNTALNCVINNYIAVSNPNVLGYYQNIKDESKEYQRKVRTVIRGMAAIAEKPDVINPFKHGLFAFEVFSHKIMRWLVPWFLLAVLITNLLVLHDHPLFSVLLIAQISMYLVAIIGWRSAAARKHSLIRIVFFFMQVNLAIADAGIKFFAGRRITKWEPSKR